MLLVLPPLAPKEDSDSHITAIATAMMELQTAEDRMVQSIQTVLRLSPESASQLEKYISPNVRARLNPSPASPHAIQVASDHVESELQDLESLGDEVRGLVPFVRNRKEAHKPSYGIR